MMGRKAFSRCMVPLLNALKPFLTGIRVDVRCMQADLMSGQRLDSESKYILHFLLANLFYIFDSDQDGTNSTQFSQSSSRAWS